jgi:serine/threonine protein phosphatase PrpC
LPLPSGTIVLLCSDGLHGAVSEDEIAACAGCGSPEEIARSLVRKAKACSADNISVVVARASTGGETRNHNDIVIRNRPNSNDYGGAHERFER